MRAIDGYDGWPTLRAVLKFTALTFAQPGEMRGALRREFDFENVVWNIYQDEDEIRRVHNRGKYWLQRVQLYASRIRRLVGGPPLSSFVVRMEGSRVYSFFERRPRTIDRTAGTRRCSAAVSNGW
jgi:hypothetical protein